MIWNEPHVIASRLAATLGASLREGLGGGDADGAVLLLTSEQLAPADDAELRTAAAVVAYGAPGAATSHGLAALRAVVAERGVDVVLATFATVPGRDGSRDEVPLVVAGPPGAEQLAQLLAAGPHALTHDAHVPAASVTGDDPPARVCVVSFEAAGMTGGGIGTASSALAELLAGNGHDVTLLFTGWQDEAAVARNEHWRARYADRGVRLAIVSPSGTSAVRNPHVRACSAYEVYWWLCGADPFDVVHLPENLGQGVFAQLAKRQGARFASTTFVIGTHGPTRWAAEANRVPLTREEFLVSEAMERTSVALADVLLGPSRYLHDYLRERDWTLPARVHVQPYATPAAVREALPADERPAAAEPSRELVFFGRIETRKGVALLCDALDLLAQDDDVAAIEVTFLGPVAEVHGEPADAYLAARARRWPWRWQIVSDRDQTGAAAYLRRPGVLAVMPSLVDNAPNTVSEVVALGIPFVAGGTGGTAELVRAEQRDEHMVGSVTGGPAPGPLREATLPSDPQPLAGLLRQRLATPVAAAEPPFEAAAVGAAYDRWHRAVRRARELADAPAPVAATPPSLTACLLFAGDDELLEAQLEALADSGVEIVVADLRHDDEPVAAATARGVAVVRSHRPGHAADARNAAVAATEGELIVLLPPGDVPLPALAGMLGEAAATEADVYGLVALDELDGPAASADENVPRAFVPLAGPALAGLSHHAFAVGPYAIRRAALARLGGFAVDARGDEADHELLNRAAAAGVRIEVVPEPLAAKRRADRWSAFRTSGSPLDLTSPYDDDQQLRVMRPLTTGDEASDQLGLLLGARGDEARRERDLREQGRAQAQEAAELRTWVDDMETTGAQLREDRDELLATTEQLREDRDELLATTEQLRDEQHRLVLDLDDARRERDALAEQLERLKAPLRRMVRALRAARDRVRRLRG